VCATNIEEDRKMPDSETLAWEDRLIAELRANGGELTSGPLAGHPLLIMTAKGARSGEPRRAILTFHREGDDYVVAGTASGSPKDPAWFHNVKANPDVTVEATNKLFDATATIATGDERDRLWDDHVKALPWFADYPGQTGRAIPMVRLTPKTT
jgi:deazaflavin-dependent oxidoreductase (nitroreductase family)